VLGTHQRKLLKRIQAREKYVIIVGEVIIAILPAGFVRLFVITVRKLGILPKFVEVNKQSHQ